MALMSPFKFRLANSGLKRLFLSFCHPKKGISVVMALRSVQTEYMCVSESVFACGGRGGGRGVYLEVKTAYFLMNYTLQMIQCNS